MPCNGMRRVTNIERIAVQYTDGTSLNINAEDGLTLCVSTFGDTFVVTTSNGKFLVFSDKPVSARETVSAPPILKYQLNHKESGNE